MSLAFETAGRTEAVDLALLGRVPDTSGALSIMGNASQKLTGALSLSFLRFEAVDGAIAQARAELQRR